MILPTTKYSSQNEIVKIKTSLRFISEIWEDEYHTINSYYI